MRGVTDQHGDHHGGRKETLETSDTIRGPCHLASLVRFTREMVDPLVDSEVSLMIPNHNSLPTLYHHARDTRIGISESPFRRNQGRMARSLSPFSGVLG